MPKGNFWITDYKQDQTGPRFDTLAELVEYGREKFENTRGATGCLVHDKQEEMEVELDEVLDAFAEGECPEDLTFF